MNKSLAFEDLPANFFNLDYTYAFDKYSCVKEFYFIHVVICYIVMISGILCMITRLFPAVKWMHAWFGKVYVSSMLLATATSLLIHNTGLPLGVLISFIWTMSGLVIGWFAISMHQLVSSKRGIEAVDKLIADQGGNLERDQKFSDLLNQERSRIADEKTVFQRVFSFKALHAIFMFVSWFNIAGRVFVTKISNDFTCHTYPAFKAGYELEGIVPTTDPWYYRAPWANMERTWAGITFFAPATFGILVGFAWSVIAVKLARK
ncbi:hypothetical protein HDU97_006903 [Phlyctochytrium planicorne]|nr:hypothetical protein HDU97_006903 [Phlyctochytrium planicorne]